MIFAKIIYCIIQIGKIQNFIINLKENSYHKEGIKNMRKFHNMIKSKLIIDNCKSIKAESLLDVACGRGGDLQKWIQSNLKYIFAFDNHADSIYSDTKKGGEYDGAISRFRQLMTKTKLPYTKFYHLDILSNNFIDKLNSLDKNKIYDVVSCQFAFHYFAKDADTINNVLSIISSKLKTGGLFIGTATDGDLLKNILDQGNVSIPLLTLLKCPEKDNCYLFYINENTDKVKKITTTQNYFEIQGVSQEFYLFKEQFKNIALQNNLELIEYKSFYEWYLELGENNLENMTIYEYVISFLNFSFIFKKI